MRRAFALLPIGLVALGACSVVEPEAHKPASVSELIDHGRFVEAYKLAEEHANAKPNDATAQSELRTATVAALLEKCRRACFADHNEEAMKYATEARDIAPDDRIVDGWYHKMIHQLAEHALGQAIEFHAQENLEAAVEKYDEALKLEPDNRSAIEGQTRALLQINHRAGMGDAYYREGAQALANYFLKEANWGFDKTIKYLPKNERALGRKADVAVLLAEERMQIAASLEERGLYAASKNEYRIATLIDPTLSAAKDGLDRTAVEASADESLAEAERMMMKKRFAEARKALERGRGQTKVQGDRFDAAFAAVQDAELDSIYTDAKTYEADYRYPDALAKYKELLDKVQVYKDAITRKENVEGFIARADKTYADALAAPTPTEQAQLLRSIAVYWPDYKDVRERLKKLDASAKP